MASSDQDVEQLLSVRTATPIAQLNPDLPDQATRKIHGEVTVTWPYSSVTKSFAFLLAEPDFRLRRDKGLVRIQLRGSSAEAAGKWDLGSGDEVTLALDGVEWAKDEEPARPAGSRSDWQLKFAGKLTLKATLGETQETKFVNIDEPVPVEAPEAVNPIPFAEIDHTLFDNDEPPVEATAPPPSTKAAPETDGEYASPIYLKRSRASYGPLFDFEELEEEEGRGSSKRRRGLRYAAVKGTWRVQEGSKSPEPEPEEDSPVTTPDQNGDVEMPDTLDKPEMVDGGVQNQEASLAPVSSSPIDTPSKSWNRADGSRLSVDRASHQTDTTGVNAIDQAPAFTKPVSSPAKPQTASNLFGQANESYGFAGFNPSTPAGGAAKNHAMATTDAAPNAFNQTFGRSRLGEFGSSESASGASAESHDSMATQSAATAFGQVASFSGFAGFGQPATAPFGSASNTASNGAFGQTSSLFGTASAPMQSPFSQITTASTGFGAPAGSLRFAFGQKSPSPPADSMYGTGETSMQPSADPYPESSLMEHQSPNHSSNASHNLFGSHVENPPYQHGLEGIAEPEQKVPLWPLGTQNFDSSHEVGRINASGDLRSDGSGPVGSPPGAIPPAVDDGTRNLDEMRQGGILSIPVYQQGGPQEALPNQEDAMAGNDDESVDSEERADYGEDEKGEDYDRVSDDEEGGGYDGRPLSDDELLEEAPARWAGVADQNGSYGLTYGPSQEYDLESDEEYDEEEEEEEDEIYEQPMYTSRPQPPPQPPVKNEPIYIDLISDSDDDGPTPAPAQTSRPQTVQQQSTEIPKSQNADFSHKESDSEDLEDLEDDDEHLDQADAARLHEQYQQQFYGHHQGVQDIDDEAESSGDEDEGLYQNIEDADDEADREAAEDEYESDIKGPRGTASLRQQIDDLAESTNDEEDEEDETQVQAGITVDSIESEAQHDAVVVDEESQSESAESEGWQEDMAEAHQTAVDISEQLGDTIDAVAVDKEPQSNLAEMDEKQDALNEAHEPSVNNTAQLEGPEDAMAVDEEEQSNLDKSGSSEEDEAERLDYDVINGSQLESADDAMVIDQDSQTNVAGSFQTQPDFSLASFESHLAAATNLSPSSQYHETEDAEMKDNTVQQEQGLQSPISENVAAEQVQGDPSGEAKAGTEAVMQAEADVSQDASEEDHMNVEAEEVSVVVLKKTYTVEVSLEADEDESSSPPTSEHHTEAQLSNQQSSPRDRHGDELQADLALSQPSLEELSEAQCAVSDIKQSQHETEPTVTAPAKGSDAHGNEPVANDVDMQDAEVADKVENDSQPANEPQSPLDNENNVLVEEAKLSGIVPEASERDESAESSAQVDVDVPSPREDVHADNDVKARLFAENVESKSDDGEEFHDASEMPQAASSPAAQNEDSFASVNSQASEDQAAEANGASLETPKRSGRKTRAASTKSAKAAIGPKKGQRQVSAATYRKVSAQQAPGTQRRTRSKTMSFRAASPIESEDVSIQMARAAIKSLPSKKRKVSATTAKRPVADIAKRLDKALSNALPLMDLKKCINPPAGRSPPDFAAVVTSASGTPKRTPIREYTSVFTVTDPSLAPNGVVQVEMFNKRSEFFPVVEVGDAILLRNFMGVSLRDRGFGLTSRSATGSSWAVFKAGGGNEPEMKTPVEMAAKETKFMLDLRSWYAGLDDGVKGKLTEAAGVLEEAGKAKK